MDLSLGSDWFSTVGRMIQQLLWGLAFLGAAGGGYLVFTGIFHAKVPPQEVVTVVRGVALATIPYVIAQIASKIGGQ
jgi:pyridoxal biosynthesis lyase PdxS